MSHRTSCDAKQQTAVAAALSAEPHMHVAHDMHVAHTYYTMQAKNQRKRKHAPSSPRPIKARVETANDASVARTPLSAAGAEARRNTDESARCMPCRTAGARQRPPTGVERETTKRRKSTRSASVDDNAQF